MISSKLTLQLVVLAALVGLVVSATTGGKHETNEIEKALQGGNQFCDVCKSYVEQFKGQLPKLLDNIKSLCRYCGSPENTKKCEDKIKKYADQIEHQSAEQTCTMLGLCGQKSLVSRILGF